MAPKRVGGEMMTECEYRNLKRKIASDSAVVAEYEKLMKEPDCVRVVEDDSRDDGFTSRHMKKDSGDIVAEICYKEGHEWIDDERTKERDTCTVYIMRGTSKQVMTLLAGLLDALGPSYVQVLPLRKVDEEYDSDKDCDDDSDDDSDAQKELEDKYGGVLESLDFDSDDHRRYSCLHKGCNW